MEEITSRRPESDPRPGAEREPWIEGRDRREWLARCLDREVRAPLLRAVLWADHLLGHRSAFPPEGDGPRSSHHAIERDLVNALSRIEDLLCLIRPDETEDDDRWLRSVLARDLIGAGLRDLDPEIRRKKLRVDLRVTPPDLRIVTDPDVALHAVEALLRAGVRSALPEITLPVRILHRSPSRYRGQHERRWVSLTVDVPSTEIPVAGRDSADGAGRPWQWSESPTGPVPLAIAAADRFAALLDGVVEVAPSTDSEGLRLGLGIPVDREPEHRPGWIP